MENDTPTLEEMLRAVIEAQTRGGHDDYQPLIGCSVQDGGYVLWLEAGELNRWSVLEILLSPAGLRAAYGEKRLELGASACECGEYWTYNAPSAWFYAAEEILHAWLSSPGGNAEQAIRTAFQLLPKS